MPSLSGNVTVGSKNVIISAKYNGLFPSGRCDLLHSDTMMAFADNPNGKLRLYKTNGENGTLIVQSTFAAKAIKEFFKVKPANRAEFKTFSQDGAVILEKPI